MTLYGPDVSSYQAGLDLSRLADAAFVIAKVTEGTYYTDGDYDGWRQQARQLGRPFMWYHFLTNEAPAAQVNATRANIKDPTLPGMLDCEPGQNGIGPSLAQIMDYTTAAHAAGLPLKLIYLPEWYWKELGSPDLRPLMALGVSLVSSSYVTGGGPVGALYPGDNGTGWQPYGGVSPVLWQFTNKAVDAGMTMDYNAFRGSEAVFQSLFNPSQGADNMPVFASGEINTGAGARTIILVPPANFGSAGWGNVWVSFGSDFGDAHLRVAAYVHGAGWTVINDVLIPADGDRVNPFGGPLPTATQKISVVRAANPEVPVGWLVEAVAR